MAPYLLFAGGYGSTGSGILTLEFDPTASPPTLQVIARAEAGAAPTWLTFSEDGKTLYADDEWAEPEGSITAFSVSEAGELTKLSTASSGGLWPCHSTLIPFSSPPRLVTVNYKGASVSSIALLPSGDLSPSSQQLISCLNTRQPGPHPDRQQQAHPHGAHLDPRGLVCVVPDLGTDDLRILGITEDGQLEEVETISLRPGDGPRHVLFSKSGDVLYVLNELDNSLTVFRVAYPSSSSSPSPSRYPSFTLLQSNLSILPASPMPHQPSFATWHSAELLLTPSNRTLIASNRAEAHDPLHGARGGPEDLLALFAVRADGTLDAASRTLVGAGGRAARHLSLSSESVRRRGTRDAPVEDGRYLAVALHDSDEVVVFERVRVREDDDGRELREVARVQDVGRPGVVLWA
ncbi:hypothetical protein JCM1841_002395 [Sporobolomyces salmonicolor]